MSDAPAWIAAGAGSTAAIAAVLTYRLVRGQNRRVDWKIDRNGATRHSGFHDYAELSITNCGALTARDVEVTFGGDSNPAPVAVTKDVSPGGRLLYTPQSNRVCEHPNTTVTVRWRGRWRRKTWTSAY